MAKRLLVFFFILIMLVVFVSFVFIYNLTHRFQGGYFISGNTQIHYMIDGITNDKTVMLVHGFAVNGDLNWRKPGIIDELAKNYKVITIDLRGHGLSNKPYDSTAYGIHMVNDLINLMDHLEIRKAHLVGYSLGGFIALKAASLYPERWYSVTEMASGWLDPGNTKAFEIIDHVAKDIRGGGPVKPVISYFDEGKKPGLIHTLGFKMWIYFFSDREALSDVLESTHELALSETALRNIKVPVCTIIGSNDPFLSSAKNMMGKVADFKLIVLEGEDHISTRNSKKAHKALYNFLTEHD